MLKQIFDRKFIALVAIGMGSINCADSVSAQDHNHPALNSFGRFFGIGWSHGYHSATTDGRFQHIKERHPAHLYASSALTYPYDRSYESAPHQFQPPLTPVQHWQAGNPPVISKPYMVGPAVNNGMRPNMPTPAPPITVAPMSAAPMTVPAPKPVEPPPTWLRPYLKDGEVGAEKPVELVPEEVPNTSDSEDLLLPDSSPSDLPPPRQSKPSADAEEDDLLIPQTNLTPMQRYHQARQKQAINK